MYEKVSKCAWPLLRAESCKLLLGTARPSPLDSKLASSYCFRDAWGEGAKGSAT